MSLPIYNVTDEVSVASSELLDYQDDDDGYEEDKSTKEQLHLATKENMAVRYLRIIVAGLLISVAAAVCVTIFKVTRTQERETFEASFIDVGAKIAESFEGTLQQRIGIVEDFTTQLTSYVHHFPNMSWPFVTLDEFEYRAGFMVRLADVMSTSLCPLVQGSELEEWNAYSKVMGDEWLARGIATRQDIPVEAVEINKSFAPTMMAIGPDGPVDAAGPGPFLPLWQTFPATEESIVNMDLKSHPTYADNIQTVLESKKPLMSLSYDFLDPEKASKDPRRPMIYSFLNAYEKNGLDYTDDPVMPVLYPGKYMNILFLPDCELDTNSCSKHSL